MRLRGVIALLCLPAVLAACGDEVSRERLVRAADKTRDAGGARIVDGGVVATGVDRSFRYRGAGFRDVHGSTDITRVYPSSRRGGSRVRTISNGDTTYFNYAGKDPFGKEWIRVPVDSRESASGSVLAGPDPNDPGAVARVLDRDAVHREGTARVRGTTTTHYAGRVELRDFESLVPAEAATAVRRAYQRALLHGGGGSLRVDLWVDENDLIRRVRQRLRLRLTGVDYPPDDQTLELFDFGLDERVMRPPKRDTEPLDP